MRMWAVPTRESNAAGVGHAPGNHYRPLAQRRQRLGCGARVALWALRIMARIHCRPTNNSQPLTACLVCVSAFHHDGKRASATETHNGATAAVKQQGPDEPET